MTTEIVSNTSSVNIAPLYLLQNLGSNCTTVSTYLKSNASKSGKSIKQDPKFKSGNKKKWICSAAYDDEFPCDWEIRVYRKGDMSHMKTKLAEVDTGCWYISTLNDVHSEGCCSVLKTPVQTTTKKRKVQEASAPEEEGSPVEELPTTDDILPTAVEEVSTTGDIQLSARPTNASSSDVLGIPVKKTKKKKRTAQEVFLADEEVLPVLASGSILPSKKSPDWPILFQFPVVDQPLRTYGKSFANCVHSIEPITSSSSLYLNMNLGTDSRNVSNLIRSRSRELGKHVHTDRKFHSGCKKQWICSDAACDWEIRMYKRLQNANKTKTKLFNVPKGCWYISKVNDQHIPNCTSTIPFLTKMELKSFSGFKAAYEDVAKPSRKEVAKKLLEMNNVLPSSYSQASLYKAMQEMKKENILVKEAEAEEDTYSV